jgi:hypothetical protein
MLLALARAVFVGSDPLGLATIFYCLRFETSVFVASYDSQGHGGGIPTCLHTGVLSRHDDLNLIIVCVVGTEAYTLL